MYEKRIKIFVTVCSALLAVCILRLAQMQLLPGTSVRDQIAELKRQRSYARQLRTVRGRILDRNGRVLATDQARFQLCVNYQLCSILDDRVQKAALLKAEQEARRKQNNPALADIRRDFQAKLAEKRRDLHLLIEKCARFGFDREQIEAKIRRINDQIWNLRTFFAWLRNDPDQQVITRYGGARSVPLSAALESFEKKFPDETDRLRLIAAVTDIGKMQAFLPLLDLKTDDDVFTAQLEFIDVQQIQILPKDHRFYPYGTVAAQTIGWVGPATIKEDIELFANDRLASYQGGELCGREDGVEHVCEAILRGRRGELVYDIDRNLVSRTETQFGKDVRLTLDIELQKEIEQYLTDYEYDPNCGPGIAAVVIDVPSGDVLAMVSLPVFDLNQARYDFSKLAADTTNSPLINRVINQWYPPGSVVKPLILIAAMQTGVVTADEVIACPAQPAPPGWPNCWIYNRYKWMGHSNLWQNNARNAIKGSCNIYFSRLADRIEPRELQRWLFKFGYGRSIVPPPAGIKATRFSRNFRHLCGRISSGAPKGKIYRFEQVPPLSRGERRWFGIGHGKLLVTPLQVANAMAVIARGGRYKQPQLFLDDPNDADLKMRAETNEVDLGISPETLAVVYEGMGAVVNETGGTAYKQFAPVLEKLARQGVKVYGKTGSTENPDNAWFGGFATDSRQRSIAIAVVVEGGQHGSSDAAPLARQIIQFAIEAGYIGTTAADARSAPPVPTP